MPPYVTARDGGCDVERMKQLFDQEPSLLGVGQAIINIPGLGQR